MISPSQRPLPDNSQHTNLKALVGIRTHDRSRPRSHWDRLVPNVLINYNRLYIWCRIFYRKCCIQHLEVWHRLMWNILYVRPMIGKCICPRSWSSYESTTAVAATAVTIKLCYSCCYCYYLELKYLVSEVCSVQNSRWHTKSRNPVISIFSAQVLCLTPSHCLLQEKNFLCKVSTRLSKPNVFILNNRWDTVTSQPNVDQVNEQMFSA